MTEKKLFDAARIVVVVPTIREHCIVEFLGAWNFEDEVRVLVIEDHAEKTFGLPSRANVLHLSHRDIERDLGADAWIIPRGTDCVRSYGYWRAWQMKPAMIVTLDDDCFPPAAGTNYFLQTHWTRVFGEGDECAWISTLDGMMPRGIPYLNQTRRKPCALNHGLWNRVPDFDAVTQLMHARAPQTFAPREMTIPRGKFFPMCGMNLAWRVEATPALYFLLMGGAYPFDRLGDIWAGVFFKRICDHLGFAVTSGAPYVEHQRASNVWANLRKEARGMEWNESLWAQVDTIRLRGGSFGKCYRELANALAFEDEYGTCLRRAMLVWADLFNPSELFEDVV